MSENLGQEYVKKGTNWLWGELGLMGNGTFFSHLITLVYDLQWDQLSVT